jgi:hypothetical protein
MATEFLLPDVAPPGNTFPSSRSASPNRSNATAMEAPSLKINTQVMVAVTETLPVEKLYPPPPVKVGNRAASPAPKPTSTVRSEPRAATPSRDSPEAPSQNSSTTLVRENESSEQSPVMRSMFPRFNPTVPLGQQQYFPTLERATPVIVPVESSQYSPSLYSHPRSPPQTLLAADPWAASRIPSTIMHASPLRITEESPPDLSTPEQLLDFWSIANGQESAEAEESYTLGLNW